MTLNPWERDHLEGWLRRHAPIDYSDIWRVFDAMVDWLANNDDTTTAHAYDAGWPRVFELACGDKFGGGK